MARVGIPRALLYYQYYPMWRTFFETLGAEVIISDTTTKAVFAAGASRVVAETCLPVKVYLGHVQALAGKCDFIFAPSVRSVEPKVYNCSKFLGLPDLVKAAVPESPPILDIEVDVNRGPAVLWQAVFSLAHHFTRNPLIARKAVRLARESHRHYRRNMWQEGLMPLEAMRETRIEQAGGRGPNGHRTAVAVIGHPYLLYDDYVNHRLIHRLETMNIRVLTPEMLSGHQLKEAVSRLEGRSYWTYEHEVVGSGVHYLKSEVDGVIGVVAFGCGPDSLMMDKVERYARHHQTRPFMCLTLDEHSAEMGILTRLEAFVDMIERRKRARA